MTVTADAPPGACSPEHRAARPAFPFRNQTYPPDSSGERVYYTVVILGLVPRIPGGTSRFDVG